MHTTGPCSALLPSIPCRWAPVPPPGSCTDVHPHQPRKCGPWVCSDPHENPDLCPTCPALRCIVTVPDHVVQHARPVATPGGTHTLQPMNALLQRLGPQVLRSTGWHLKACRCTLRGKRPPFYPLHGQEPPGTPPPLQPTTLCTCAPHTGTFGALPSSLRVLRPPGREPVTTLLFLHAQCMHMSSVSADPADHDVLSPAGPSR